MEVGFIHLRATILASGMLDNTVDKTNNYECEKTRVNDLLQAGYCIENINGSVKPKALLEKLVKKELNDWWKDSRYNVQVDAEITRAMDMLKHEVSRLHIRVIGETTTRLFVENITCNEYVSVQKSILGRFPGLITYYAPTR